MTSRPHPRAGRPGLYALAGQPAAPTDPAAGPAETDHFAETADAIAAAIEWDRAAAAEPWQVDVTRSLDDTTRMGNSLSAAVRLELLADSMRADVLERRVVDPVSGAALDPADGLPLPDEDLADYPPPLRFAAPAPPVITGPQSRPAPTEDGVNGWTTPEPTPWDQTADLPRVTVQPPPARSADAPAVTASRAQVTGAAGLPRRVLDWAGRHDERSRGYGVRGRLAGPAPLVDRIWAHGPILDQGTTPPLSLHDASGCTGHAGVAAANVLAITEDRPADLDHEDAMRLYELAQDLDEWPGDTYPGTSVLALMKAGVESGYWGSYLWAFGTRDLAQGLLQRGPAVIGIPWLAGMETPGPDGIVTVSGDQLGGHALCVSALRMTVAGKAGPWFGALQSRGPDHGDAGVIWIHHKDMATLLHSRGEAAFPVMAAA